ncbi:MAG: epoxyqueuosine reductase QueH [Lachnospiraceae bacterium]|nr:epoxyqueuosine reductase QueH [Lachnospiraceae bacterium]
MERRNYQKELDERIKGLDHVPTLLLHVCCAPCSSYVLEYLSEFFEITVYYYNPNIAPKEEYELRASEVERLVREQPHRHPVHVLTEAYGADVFYQAVRGLEKEKEGGARCEVCFRLRLMKSAETAKVRGFDYFTTTLTISPLKNADLLNRVGEEAGKAFGVAFLPSDFKKKGGYQRSIELSREYGLYRQNYCGCLFSKQRSTSDCHETIKDAEERRTADES